MLALKLLLTVAGAGLLVSALAIPLYSLWLRLKTARKAEADGESIAELKPVPWRTVIALAAAGCVPALLAESIVVVPSGMGGVRISQLSGTLPGTLYPGVHFIAPLVDSVELFDLRDHLFTAGLGRSTARRRRRRPA